jgi:hypothetical protein
MVVKNIVDVMMGIGVMMAVKNIVGVMMVVKNIVGV